MKSWSNTKNLRKKTVSFPTVSQSPPIYISPLTNYVALSYLALISIFKENEIVRRIGLWMHIIYNYRQMTNYTGKSRMSILPFLRHAPSKKDVHVFFLLNTNIFESWMSQPVQLPAHRAFPIELHLPLKPNISVLCNHKPNKNSLSGTVLQGIFARDGKVHNQGPFCRQTWNGNKFEFRRKMEKLKNTTSQVQVFTRILMQCNHSESFALRPVISIL